MPSMGILLTEGKDFWNLFIFVWKKLKTEGMRMGGHKPCELVLFSCLWLASYLRLMWHRAHVLFETFFYCSLYFISKHNCTIHDNDPVICVSCVRVLKFLTIRVKGLTFSSGVVDESDFPNCFVFFFWGIRSKKFSLDGWELDIFCIYLSHAPVIIFLLRHKGIKA